MQPGSEQLAGCSVVNGPTAFYRARPGPAFTNTNSCYCQNGLKSIFSHIKLSKLSVLTPPAPVENEGVATLILTTLPFQRCDLSVQEIVDLPHNYTQDILYKGLKQFINIEANFFIGN